jgi:endonuclease/exonuclease/phosphatase family metal-dependent hydrolase
LYTNISFCGITICSWNLKDFGKSKSDAEISFVANVLKTYDVVAIQEVVAGNGGGQAIVRLVNELNTKGSKWDYTISDPTSSSAYKTERYAYIWKTNKVTKKGNAWLEKKYHIEIDREPYYITFSFKGKTVTLVNFHAITKSKQPETEVKFFKFLPGLHPGKLLLFLGDYNLPQSHTVFNPLKRMGYSPILINQKTSLKERCAGAECLASEFDNMFINREKCIVKKSGIIPFYQQLQNFSEARLISDHVPVFAEIEIL